MVLNWGNLTGSQLTSGIQGLICVSLRTLTTDSFPAASRLMVMSLVLFRMCLPLLLFVDQPALSCAECNMCLDGDFFDLWRSCGDCNITRFDPDCQLSCNYCTAGEGIDTAQLPAPRANQQLAIPAAGCSVDRLDYQLECRAQSTGTCGMASLYTLQCLCYNSPVHVVLALQPFRQISL